MEEFIIYLLFLYEVDWIDGNILNIIIAINEGKEK